MENRFEDTFKTCQCGSHNFIIEKTDNGIKYKCKNCGRTYEDTSVSVTGAYSMHNDYRTERQKVKSRIERLVDVKFVPTSCCGVNPDKMFEHCDLRNGFSYECPKCHRIQFDEDSKEGLDLLYNLADMFPNATGRDPVYHYLFIQLWTRNFQVWNDRATQRYIEACKSSFDKEDAEYVQSYKTAYDELVRKHQIDIGELVLCPVCHKVYIAKEEELCEHCKFERKEKAKNKQAKIDEKKRLKSTPEGIKKRKKRAILASVLSLLILLCVGTMALIVAFTPKTLFGSNMIEYFIDGERYTTEAVFSKYIEIEKPSKLGYKFLGLFTDEQDGEMVVGPDGKSVKRFSTQGKGALIKLYPMWESIEYTLEFDLSGGNGNINEPYYVKYGEPMKEISADVSKVGYSLKGWCDANNELVIDATGKAIAGKELLNTYNYAIPDNEQAKIILHALWEANKYVVTLDANGGDEPEDKTAEVEFDSITSLPIPTYKGHIFNGWVLDSKKITDENGLLIAKWNKANNDQVLVADWDLMTVTISFTDCNAIQNITAKYGQTCELPKPARYKYDTFIGWEYNGSVYKDSITAPDKDISLTAKWDTNGWTYISTSSEFSDIGRNLSGKYLLLNDIDLGQWQTMGSTSSTFSGVLDGNFKTITYKLTIGDESSGAKMYGLFSQISGTVQDLTVDGTLTKTKDTYGDYETLTGGICGQLNGGTLKRVHFKGLISRAVGWGQLRHTGGLVGKMTGNAKIIACKNSANIKSSGFDSEVGGLVGYMDGNSVIENSYNIGQVYSTSGDWIYGKTCAGGIVGMTNNENGTPTIKACFFAGNSLVSDHRYNDWDNVKGAIVGTTGGVDYKNGPGVQFVGNQSPRISDCYYTMSGVAIVGNPPDKNKYTGGGATYVSKLTGKASGFSDEYWIFDNNNMPRLKGIDE